MQDEERKRLLWPSWATNGNGPRYDELSDEDKAVWRMTRGQKMDADSELRWIDDLADGIGRGIITLAEAQAAIRRVGRADDKS